MPIDDTYQLDGQTEEEKDAIRREKNAYKKQVWGVDGRDSNEPKYSFFQPGNYTMDYATELKINNIKLLVLLILNTKCQFLRC